MEQQTEQNTTNTTPQLKRAGGSFSGRIDTFIKVKELKPGDKFCGTYLDSFSCGEYETVSHKLLTSDGKILGINGTGQLNKTMTTVAKNAYAEITYKGQEVIQKGPRKGKMAHQWEVMASELVAPGEQAPF